MRIGLTGGGCSVAGAGRGVRAEAGGFSSVWYASAIGGDRLVTMALAGRAAARIGAPLGVGDASARAPSVAPPRGRALTDMVPR